MRLRRPRFRKDLRRLRWRRRRRLGSSRLCWLPWPAFLLLAQWPAGHLGLTGGGTRLRSINHQKERTMKGSRLRSNRQWLHLVTARRQSSLLLRTTLSLRRHLRRGRNRKNLQAEALLVRTADRGPRQAKVRTRHRPSSLEETQAGQPAKTGRRPQSRQRPREIRGKATRQDWYAAPLTPPAAGGK